MNQCRLIKHIDRIHPLCNFVSLSLSGKYFLATNGTSRNSGVTKSYKEIYLLSTLNYELCIMNYELIFTNYAL